MRLHPQVRKPPHGPYVNPPMGTGTYRGHIFLVEDRPLFQSEMAQSHPKSGATSLVQSERHTPHA